MCVCVCVCVCIPDSYTVRFFDGVVLTVKPTKIKPFKDVRNTALPLVLVRLD